jgi:hypothetical protein
LKSICARPLADDASFHVGHAPPAAVVVVVEVVDVVVVVVVALVVAGELTCVGGAEALVVALPPPGVHPASTRMRVAAAIAESGVERFMSSSDLGANLPRLRAP